MSEDIDKLVKWLKNLPCRLHWQSDIEFRISQCIELSSCFMEGFTDIVLDRMGFVYKTEKQLSDKNINSSILKLQRFAKQNDKRLFGKIIETRDLYGKNCSYGITILSDDKDSNLKLTLLLS